ncbi:HAD-IA family hydrolase [Mesorhizobium salmacidum]|uniref:HAD-IA family hydrolase n=1 Tax=Mesorhizobium salmacidum TaxID=3015171 RepID=A0ABU8KVU9_9HYPH
MAKRDRLSRDLRILPQELLRPQHGVSAERDRRDDQRQARRRFRRALECRPAGSVRHGVEAIPYVREFIEAVRAAGIAYCVATSARISKMHITLGQTGLLPLFEHAMFSATMVSRGKPFPDLFLHAARTMGFAPADCIVIEDSVAGTQAGIAAGMRVFSYHGDPYTDRDGLIQAGGILFDDVRELAGLVPIH